MDISKSLAAQTYAASKAAAEPNSAGLGQQTGAGFARMATDFATMLQENEATTKAALTGDADPLSLVQALAESQLAVEAAVSVRDRVVEAYQEILRMPV
ncbi:MAG: flagellar hook-basal body complex protein FliE [Pseudomonadota bacterium]